MKIPKFKVWDKHIGEMFSVGIIDYTIRSVYVKQPNGFYSERDFDRVELLQFTGLKDKTGKEVYEGDIVRFYDDYDEEYIASVVFIDCLGAYGVKWDGFQSSFDEINEYYSKDIEVIGNIWQTPELLEK